MIMILMGFVCLFVCFNQLNITLANGRKLLLLILVHDMLNKLK